MRKFIKTSIVEYFNGNDVQDKKYIVYHSSNEKFNNFDLSKITNFGGDLYGKGFYFTDNINYSKQFGKYTYKCEIILNTPLNLTNNSTKEQLTILLKNINKPNVDFDTILSLINSNSYTTAFRYIRKYLSFNELKNLFDGVIGYADAERGKEYVVYYTENIKILSMEELS